MAGRSINDWLGDPAQIPAFLQALEGAGWFQRGQDPEHSRFWRLIQGERAEMFGVFSPLLNSIVPGLGNSRAKQATATFAITNSVIVSHDLDIRATAMRMNFKGAIDFDGKIDGRIEAELASAPGDDAVRTRIATRLRTLLTGWSAPGEGSEERISTATAGSGCPSASTNASLRLDVRGVVPRLR